MTASPDIHETPLQLGDALARIDQAKEDYKSLAHDVTAFLYNYVKGMLKGFDPTTGTFQLQISHPEQSAVRGRPAVLVSQIVEHLRAALDYMTSQLSVLNEPQLNERKPQFVIANSALDFKQQAKTRLHYLTDEQKSFVEQIQPYQGNKMLALLGRMANHGKHRSLLSIRNNTDLDIVFAEIAKRDEYEDWFIYPLEKERAIFAKPKDELLLLLYDQYDAMTSLCYMIGHVEDILRSSYRFFANVPE